MEDKELLEKAAKAAGYEWQWYVAPVGQLFQIKEHSRWVFWSPLADDGDALRLAVKLNLQVTIEDARCGCITVEWGDEFDDHVQERSQSPEFAAEATRRAITRAAAAIAD